jgi:hypothetical protein
VPFIGRGGSSPPSDTMDWAIAQAPAGFVRRVRPGGGQTAEIASGATGASSFPPHLPTAPDPPPPRQQAATPPTGEVPAPGPTTLRAHPGTPAPARAHLPSRPEQAEHAEPADRVGRAGRTGEPGAPGAVSVGLVATRGAVAGQLALADRICVIVHVAVGWHPPRRLSVGVRAAGPGRHQGHPALPGLPGLRRLPPLPGLPRLSRLPGLSGLPGYTGGGSATPADQADS